MILEFNGKKITENRILSAFIMSVGIVVLSIISNLFMIIFEETMAFLVPNYFERGLFLNNFGAMMSGGIISLLGFVTLFGRKGSSFSLNTNSKKEELS